MRDRELGLWDDVLNFVIGNISSILGLRSVSNLGDSLPKADRENDCHFVLIRRPRTLVSASEWAGVGMNVALHFHLEDSWWGIVIFSGPMIVLFTFFISCFTSTFTIERR